MGVPEMVAGLLISQIASSAIGAATAPDAPEIPEPEKPALAPEEAKRSAEARRRKVRSGGRPSTRLTQPLGGPQSVPPTGANQLTGY
jgi:hypothetical protein